jgi:hypothetical protein
LAESCLLFAWNDSWLIANKDEPHKGDNGLLVKMVNDFPSGEYTIEAGFILKENRQDKYPEFYRQTFAFKK